MGEGQAGVSSEPLVSVVVPAYNAAEYIDRCLDSVRCQTHSNLEIIVVDDGSADDTLDRIRKHASEDSRITVLTQENRYAGVARNEGFSHASGEYVAFLDADDFFDSRMIESMVGRACDAKADVVVCRSNFYDDVTDEIRPIGFSLQLVECDSVYSGYELRDVMFRFCVGWPWDKLYRSEFVRKHDLRFQDLRTSNDAYFVFMSLMLAERIAFVGDALVMHRTNNANSLERTRSRSWENAGKAALAIGRGLRNEGLYEMFERSYVNWFLSFSLWNLDTLDGDARDGLLEDMEKNLAPLLPDDAEDGFYIDERERIAAEVLRSGRFEAVRWSLLLDIDLARAKSDVTWLKEHIEKLERELAWRDEAIERLGEEKRDILQSRTYAVGKAVMAAPCAVKDALGRRKRDR